MSAEIINLRTQRKRKARAANEAVAAENRVKFGLSKREKSLGRATKELTERQLSGHEIKKGEPEA